MNNTGKGLKESLKKLNKCNENNNTINTYYYRQRIEEKLIKFNQ